MRLAFIAARQSILGYNARHGTDRQENKVSDRHAFKIDMGEEFENLPNAPIVEAVIHWQARSETIQSHEQFYDHLKEQLADYPASHPEHEIKFQAEIGSEGMATNLSSPSWCGFRFNSDDELHIAQFKRDGFAFSRLKPYENWAQFEAEALRLWNIYLELAKPPEVQRLGVRFINLISPIQTEQFTDLLTIPPKSPANMPMPIQGLMHKTTFDIPGHPYHLNVIQAMQPPIPTQTEGLGLILDIDVFTTHALEPKEELLKHHLNEMRWIKDKAFFTFLTEDAIKKYRD